MALALENEMLLGVDKGEIGAVYKVSSSDSPLADEFRAKPIGHHSPALQKVLNVFRGEPMQDKYVLICRKPHEEWVLGQLTGQRGQPIRLLEDQVFRSIDDAERHVFKLRWKKHTGQELAD